MGELEGELGDLLLQVVYHARMAEEAGAFGFADVVRGDRRQDGAAPPARLRRRRAATRAPTSRPPTGSGSRPPSAAAPGALAGVAVGLPALTRAVKLQNRAARVGFDWPDAGAVLDKIAEETAELVEARDAGDAERLAEEYGDLMFVMANLARHLRLDPEAALRGGERQVHPPLRGDRGGAGGGGPHAGGVDASRDGRALGSGEGRRAWRRLAVCPRVKPRLSLCYL